MTARTLPPTFQLGKRIGGLCPAQFKSEKATDGTRRLVGYASTFGNRDHHDDIVVKGAFQKTILEQFPKGLIYPLFDHTRSFGALGVAFHLEEDSTGLLTVTEPRNGFGREILDQCEGDPPVYRYMSIGFDPIVEESQTGPDGRLTGATLLKEIRLREYSIVFWPANEAASATGFKAIAEACSPVLMQAEEVLSFAEGRERLTKGEREYVSTVFKHFQDLQAALTAHLPRFSALLGTAPGEPPSGVFEPQPTELHSLLAELKQRADEQAFRLAVAARLTP